MVSGGESHGPLRAFSQVVICYRLRAGVKFFDLFDFVPSFSGYTCETQTDLPSFSIVKARSFSILNQVHLCFHFGMAPDPLLLGR